MEFGSVPLALAEGAVLAHSVNHAGRRMAKGQVLTPADLAQLAAAGISHVMVARPGPGDIDEDAAALRLARALVPDPQAAGLAIAPAHGGRVNLKAQWPGLLDFDPAAIVALNRVDPAITLAVLAPLARVGPGNLAGTVKIIPYAVPGADLARACARAGAALRVRPVRLGSAGLILTETPGEAPARPGDGAPGKLAAKARSAVAGRLASLGMALAGVITVPHEAAALAEAITRIPGEMVLILTEAATSDLRDTAPEALRRAGGRVIRYGIPVDPGNLLFHGILGPRPVIGLPGCVRSPALNGADWVLERLACGIPLDDAAVAAMSVGGLLKEIPQRGRPRED
jgi:molybdenum cofactor cytidylyltransferase